MEPASKPVDPSELSILELLAVLLRHRRKVVFLTVGVAVLVILVTLLWPRHYTSSASFTPSTGSAQLSQLAGLASQLGVSVPTGQSSQSPDFYANLLESRQLLQSTVTTRYTFASSTLDSDTLSGDLVELFDAGGHSRGDRVDESIRKLKDRTSVSTDPTTGLVTLDVTTHWAELSQRVNSRMLDLVNSFNLETRQTQAAAERRFLQNRVASAQKDLRAAEDSLEVFLQHNRSYQNSPQLQFEYDRLQRHLSLRQQVFTTLAQSLEQARVEEVRNTPVITVVEPPPVPVRPDRRHLMLKALAGLVVGAALGIIWAFGGEWAVRARAARPAEYREVDTLVEQARADLAGVWHRVRALLTRRGRRT